jgi:glycolate oxidase iron-sulfur subunit
MALIEAVLDGKLRVSDVYKDRLATCTGCLACESACASGVPFSRIILAAREQALRESGPGIVAGLVSAALKNSVLMRSLAWLAPVALHYKGKSMRPIQNSIFKVQQGKKQKTGGRKDNKKGPKGRIGFFPGCAIEQFQPDIGSATVRVLEVLGYEVVTPARSVCCGRPFLSLGDRSEAEELARKNHDLLAALDVDTVVTSCASCGLTFKKDYPTLLAPLGREPVRVQDIHEFLAGKTGDLDLSPVAMKVTWHDPCHLSRGQGLSKTAREILKAVPGIELIEMKYPDRCCGFGGVMRVSHPSLSGMIGEAKAKDIAGTQADVVIAGCPGCRMQIADSLRRTGSETEVVHTVQVLDAALRNAGSFMKRAELETTGPMVKAPKSRR